MHISLPIGKEAVLMGCDCSATFGQSINFGNNISLAINTVTREDAEKFFQGLSSGGEVKMPIQDTFWGAYFGVVTDKFGIHWSVSADLKTDD